jgi:hypothetical protein
MLLAYNILFVFIQLEMSASVVGVGNFGHGFILTPKYEVPKLNTPKYVTLKINC